MTDLYFMIRHFACWYCKGIYKTFRNIISLSMFITSVFDFSFACWCFQVFSELLLWIININKYIETERNICICNIRFCESLMLLFLLKWFIHMRINLKKCCRALLAIRKRYIRDIEQMAEFVGSVTISYPVGSHDVGKNCDDLLPYKYRNQRRSRTCSNIWCLGPFAD